MTGRKSAVKAIKDLEDIHFAVARSYLKAVGRKHGLLLNFAKIMLEAKRVIAFSGVPAFLPSSRSPYGGVSCRCESGRGNRLFARVVIVDAGMG